jgi:hypothetical protein
VHPNYSNPVQYAPPAPAAHHNFGYGVKSHPVYATDPRIPLGLHNSFTPTHPAAQYPMIGAPGSHSPRDPRLMQPYQHQPFLHAPIQMPFGGYGPPQSFNHPPQPSRSQPVRRRRSYSSSSSDSDAAAEISARIMGSSDDPRELDRIMKDTKGRERRSKQKKRRTIEASPKVAKGRVRRSGSFIDDMMESHDRLHRRDIRRSMSPFNDNEIPAAIDVDYFNDPVYESPSRRRQEDRKKKRNDKQKRTKKRRSMSEAVTRREMGTSTSGVQTAMVPYHPREPRNRTTEKDQIGERIVEYWDPATVQPGKRQRLPRLDWRKGEKYLTAPDGTIVGKIGYSRLVCDDTLGFQPSRRKPAPTEKRRPTNQSRRDSLAGKRRISVVENRSDERIPPVESRSRRESDEAGNRSRRESDQRRSSAGSRRESDANKNKSRKEKRSSGEMDNQLMEGEAIVAGAPSGEDRPLLNAFDFLQKDEHGVYNIGRHKVLHRASDRQWGERMEEGGFRLCPSISTADAYIAEIALEPGHTDDRAPETLLSNQVIYGRVVQAAANSIRLQIMGQSDERLSEDDEFYIEQGSTYLLTNLSNEKTAVLSLVAFE